MKIPALLSLHPAWNEVAELDQLIAHVSGLPSAPSPVSVPLPEAKFPGPLTAGIAAPPATPPPPAGSRRAATERIARLRESLNEHSQRVMDRERAAMEKRLEAEAAVERSRIRALPASSVIARNPEDEKTLRKLELEAIALESQVRVLFEPALGVAQKRLNEVAAQIKALQAPPAVREEVEEAAIEKQVAEFRGKRRAEMEKELAQRAAQVGSTSAEAVTAYRTGLRTRLAEATPPAAMNMPKTAPMPNPALPSPAQVAAATFKPGGSPSLGAPARLADLRAQRARLVKVITEDIDRRIQGMATQYHWTLVPEGASGADLTPQAADLLRKQWETVKSGTVFHN